MGEEGESELVMSDPKEQMDEIIVALNLDKVSLFYFVDTVLTPNKGFSFHTNTICKSKNDIFLCPWVKTPLFVILREYVALF